MLMARYPARAPAAPRVQIFASDLSATGVVRNAIAIANAAAAAGCDVRLLTCRSDGPLRDELSPDVGLVDLLGPKAVAAGRRSQLQGAFFAYRRHSRAWRPDILLSAGNHAHLLSTFAWLGLPGSKILRISNDLGHGSPAFATRLLRSVKFRFMTSRADRLVLVSRALAQHRLLAREAAGGKAAIVPNGVDVEAVHRAARHSCPHPWAKDRQVPIVLAVGRHVRQKNLDTLLAGFARARRQRPMRLMFLGAGTGAQTQRLRDRVSELALDDDVDFVRPTANPFPYMASAGVLALPSLWEGSANVLLEAMACGTPVIAARSAGDAEHVLQSGRYGVLVDANDVEGLALAILCQTGAGRVEPGDRARSFDRAQSMRQYLRLFDELVQNADPVRTPPRPALAR